MVTDQLRVEDVCIQNVGKPRRARHLKLEPQCFRQLGQVLQGLFRLLLLRGLAALAETRADLAAGRTVQESPEAHLARLDALNAVNVNAL